MNIVYISNSIIPSRTANSIHVMKMGQALADNGHSVALLTPNRDEGKSKVENIYEHYGVRQNFKVIKLPWKNVKGRAYFYGYQTSKEIRKIKPDVIYGRFLPGLFFSSILNNKKIIYESHQPVSDLGRLQVIMLKLLIKRNYLSRLVVISNALKEHYIEKYGVNKDIIKVAHDGADPPKSNLQPFKIYSKKEGALNVGYIGHLYPGKGMEIVSELVKRMQHINFHIIGGSEEDINFWKKQMDIFNNVHFYGFVPHSETLNYGLACDVLLAPYLKKVTGFGGSSDLSKWMSPLKLFEYMSLGKPIICSDLPVLREIIKDNENGLMCDPNNIEDWIHSINLMKENQKLREKISNKAKEDFMDNYTWKKRAKEVLSNIEDFQ